jgi:cobalt-zinc-cadmium efflux system membrane fusion protein
LAISPSDLATIHEGRKITITAGTGDESSPATIMFVSPLLDKDTRFARVVASVDNAARKWRPGSFITAEIPMDEAPAAVVVPKTALQSLKADTVIFVRTADGFEARKVGVGRHDARLAEVTDGLAVGERIATTNTFILKAELGKAEVGHED